MSFFNAKDQTKIFYSDAGEGAPVILIHGWPLSADMWEYQKLDFLRRGLRVIGYDRRGFGRSDQPGAGYDYNTFADDLNSLIEHLDLQKVSLVGFSMGGGEIARYLSRHGSDRIASAALVSSVTPYMLKDASNPNGIDESAFAKMASGLEEDRPSFLSDFTKQFFGVNAVSHPVSQETQQWCNSVALQASLKATIDCVGAFGKTDFRKDMTAFATVPTLIIHGKSDKTVPFAISGEAAAKMIPSAIFKPYDGAAHGLFITHKKQLNSDLFAFIDANSSKVPFAHAKKSTAIGQPTVNKSTRLT
jgi:non-heme chloroperoxidase